MVSPFHPGWRHVAGNRFPLKHLADALSLAQIVIRGGAVMREPVPFSRRLDCIRFFFEPESIRNLYVAPSRSGSIWSLLGMALAVDLHLGGDGSYENEGGDFWPRGGLNYRYLDWRVPTGAVYRLYERQGGPVFGEQMMFHGRLPYSKLRCARLKDMKIVLITRSILAALDSRFHKFVAASNRPDVTLDDERSFDWDRYLSDAIEFHNSWGDVLAWHPNIRHFRFEDMKADPVGTHRDILGFWGHDIPRACLAESFRRISKKEMAKHLTPGQQDPNVRISNRNDAERGRISKPLKDHIVMRLNRELAHPMGYDYNDDRGHYVNYD